MRVAFVLGLVCVVAAGFSGAFAAPPGTPDLESSSDTGLFDDDNITQDTTPQFTGTCEDGATVTLNSSVDGDLTPTCICSSSSYDITVSSALSENTHNITASQDGSAASGALSVTIDTTNPTVTIDKGASQADPTNSSPITFDVVFSENVYNFDIPDVTLSGTANDATVNAVTGSGATYWVTVTGMSSDGTVTTTVNAHGCEDPAGNGNDASTSDDNTVIFDTTPPTVSIGEPSSTRTNTGPVTYTVTYGGADAVTLAPGDVTLNKTGSADGTVAVSGSGTGSRTVAISAITGDGTLGITIAAGTASDNAENTAVGAGPSTTFNVDNTPPTVSISEPSSTHTINGPVTYTVTYGGADAVTLVAGDVTLNKTWSADGTVAVGGSGTDSRTITISAVTGDGTLGITIAAGTATDNVGNTAPGAGPSTTFNVGGTPAVFRVNSPGDVFADQTFHATAFLVGAADVAEWVMVAERVGPGSVVEFDPASPGRYRRSRGVCSTLVGGVVSTEPGFILADSSSTIGMSRLALCGIVPVKVTNEGGPIVPGDLLVTSSTPGHAMRWAGPDPCPCSLVGKALEPMLGESGIILVLLTAH